MRVLVAYSSLSGGTKRLAEGIFTSLPYEEKTLATIQEAPSLEGYDAILVGYWANQGAPGQDVQQLIGWLRRTGWQPSSPPDGTRAWIRQ